MTFPDVETTAPSPVNLTRQKRQLADQAIAQATAAQWAEAAATNRRLLELGADAESENRLAKALWELGELGSAREHYQTALALDPTNRIAERNIDRLKMLMRRGRREDRPRPGGEQGPGQHLRRGDRQDRLRLPDRPRRPAPARPGQPGRRGRADARGQPAHRPSAMACASGSSSRGSPPGCSS